MYAIDPSSKARIEPLLRRVLIVDANAHMAAMLTQCLRAFGSREVTVVADPTTALAVAEALDPTLIVTEAFGDDDPFALVQSVRRSSMACRAAPIMVLTTLATASALKMAKNAGAHEFLRKPFAYRDVMRRLDQLARQPRSWVEKPAYTGPDRRLFNGGGAWRRLSDRVGLISQGVPATRLYTAR